MPVREQGSVRSSQVITTYGPGALIDLPRHSAIVCGLDSWPNTEQLVEIEEPRLVSKLQSATGVASPRLFAPPTASSDPRERTLGIRAVQFPEWFVVQEDKDSADKEAARRLVHRKGLDSRGEVDRKRVVATRFVRACARGHVDDLDWREFAHQGHTTCRRQLWLDETGTTGDLGHLSVRCECGKHRRLYEAVEMASLGPCRGSRPWIGKDAREECSLPSKLLIRTASDAYFPQVLSVLSLPDRGSELQGFVNRHWSDFQHVEDDNDLRFVKKKLNVDQRLPNIDSKRFFQAIHDQRSGASGDRPVKQVEIESILSSPVGYGDDIPVDEDFHARKLPRDAWCRSALSDGIASVIQLHRLREVLALIGFTRLGAEMPNIHGEYESDVERASIAREPTWFPAVENRGEGVFIQLGSEAVEAWRERASVEARCADLMRGHDAWNESRKKPRPFPGGAYILLHTLSHLLIQAFSMHCGYPASSIRERIYVEESDYGILLYTGSPDADGTLGGLVQQARHIEDRLREAARSAKLCSNDPICSRHVPAKTVDERPDWQSLHGAACHGCTLISETSCEMRNDYLDRALVVPVLGLEDVAFFGGTE